MIKAKPHEKDGQTWNDVWYVRIPEEDEINQIIFSDVPLKNRDEDGQKYAGRTDGGKTAFGFQIRKRLEENLVSMRMPVILRYTSRNIETVTGLKHIRFGMQRSIRKPILVRASI